MKKGMFIIPVSMILVIGLVILGATPTEFSAQEAKNYTMAVNGEQYPILSTMAGMINKYSKNLKLNLKATASSEESLRLTQSGKVDFFASEGYLCCKAVDGEKPFSAKLDQIRMIGWMHGNPLQIAVPADREITFLMDLRGKRVVVGDRDSHNAASVRTVFEMAGLSFKDFIPLFLGFSEGIAALKTGRADALAIQAAYPDPALVELSGSLPIRLVPVDVGIAHSIYRKCPEYILTVFPANIYKGQTKTVLVIDSPHVWGASASVSADHVYQLLRLTKEHIEEMAQVDKKFKQWKFKQSCQKTGALHPGAVSFYEEMDPGCSFRLIF